MTTNKNINEKAFDALVPFQGETFCMTGDFLIVEVFPEEEVVTKTGLVVVRDKRQIEGVYADSPLFCKVMLVGDGYTDEDGKDVPLSSKRGDIVLFGQHSVKRFSKFGDLIPQEGRVLALAKDSEVQMRWDSEKSYNDCMSAMNKAALADNNVTS